MKNTSKNSRKQIKFICTAAFIASMYVVLTWISALFGLSSGIIQIRISEMLCALPIFTAAAIPGVTIGCLIANMLTGALMLDVIFGTLATLIGALGTYLLRKHPIPALLMPVASNTLIIPSILAYVYLFEGGVAFFTLTVGIGEMISAFGIGLILYKALNKRSKYIFE